MSEVIQDEAYYKKSNGGITLSGGEALCQKEFAEELVDACNEKNISVAIETNLCHPFESIKSILGKASHIYTDIKLFDNQKHIQWTGIDNKLLFENTVKLANLNKPVTIRTPLIAGVTDTKENMAGIYSFISGISNITEWEWLNFNPLGAGKYENLSLANPFKDARPLSGDVIRALYDSLEKGRIPIRVS